MGVARERKDDAGYELPDSACFANFDCAVFNYAVLLVAVGPPSLRHLGVQVTSVLRVLLAGTAGLTAVGDQ